MSEGYDYAGRAHAVTVSCWGSANNSAWLVEIIRAQRDAYLAGIAAAGKAVEAIEDDHDTADGLREALEAIRTLSRMGRRSDGG